MGYKHWTEAELDYLLSIAGDFHLEEVCKYYNRWAAVNGRQARTERGIRNKLMKSHVSIRPEGAWVTLMDAARALKRSNNTIRAWIDKSWIDQKFVRRPTPRSTIIRRKAFDILAQEKPGLFAGCSMESLLSVFNSEVIAEKIHELVGTKICSTHPKPVECLETGKKYPSVDAAAKDQYISANSIRRSIKLGTTTSVGTWKAVSRVVY